MDYVHIAGDPKADTLWPAGLSAKGTTFQLAGTAEHHERAANCSDTISTLEYSWTVKYEDPNGVESDVTVDLTGTNTLQPSFHLANEGTYYFTLAGLAVPKLDKFTVSVFDPGYRWVNIGPNGTSTATVGKISGRINSIAFDPTRPGTIYVATAQGGVWKTSNAGTLWLPTMDNKGLPSMGVGAVAVALDGSKVYAATGDPLGQGDNALPGRGIWASTDGGQTWAEAGGPNSPSCPNPLDGQFWDIIVDPANASTVYAAGMSGVWRSTNAGACWTPIRGNLPAGAIYDLAFLPGNSTVLFAVSPISGVVRTNDPFNTPPTWTTLLRSPSTAFPGELTLRGSIAPSPANNQYLYAMYMYRDPSGTQKFLESWRSTNQGVTWTQLPLPYELQYCTNANQCDYVFATIASQTDPNVAFHGDVRVWKFQYFTSELRGWSDWSGPAARTTNASGVDIHADIQAFAFDPNNPNMLYAGTDGGIYRFDLSGNPSAATGNWTSLNNNLAIAQFRSLGVRPFKLGTYDLAGGLQDNGTQARLSGRAWGVVGGGDGWWAQYDAGLYPNPPSPPFYWNPLYFNENAGFNGDVGTFPSGGTIGRAGMFWGDPFRAGVMLADSRASITDTAGSQLYPSLGTRGQLFYASTVYASGTANWTCIDPTANDATDSVKWVAPARIKLGDPGWYYVGTDRGRIYMVDVTPSPPIYPVCGAGQSATRSVTQIYQSPVGFADIDGLAEDPAQPCVVYASVNASSLAPADRIVRLSAPQSGGGCGSFTAVSIAGNLTTSVTIHSHAIAADPLSTTLVYAGTDRGLYVGSFDGAQWNWSRHPDVPAVEVTDIRAPVNASGADGTLYLSTFGRSMYERVQVLPPTIQSSRPARPSLNNEIRSCRLREIADPALGWQVAEVEAEYSYNGDQGMDVHLRPVVLSGGLVSPYFIRETQTVVTGTHTVHLQVLYAAADAPPGLATDGLRVEMHSGGGGSFADRRCDQVKSWRRPDARTLEVRTEDRFDEALPFEPGLPVQVALSNGAVETHTTPFSIFITQGLTVNLQAPASYYLHGELRPFHLWTTPGHLDVSPVPAFAFVLSDDRTSVARYNALERRLYLPLLRR